MIVNADALNLPIASNTVQCCITSPPYFNLRNYSVVGQIGLENTIEEYVENLVTCFREVKRVLRDDGSLFLNLGDSYSNDPGNGRGSGSNLDGGNPHLSGSRHVGSNFANCFYRLIKSSPLIFGNSATIGITPKSGDISLHDNGLPYRKFLSLFGVKRVTIKQRDNNFCQILHTLADPCYCWISYPVAFMSRNVTDLEIILDAGDSPNIIISNHYANGKSELIVPWIVSDSSKGGYSSLAVKESGKPITEIVSDGQAVGNSVTFDSPLESLPDIYFINQTVPFGNGFYPSSSDACNFRVTKSTHEQVSFSASDGRFYLTALDVSHLFFLNSYGSFVRYIELYDKAIRKSNATQAKQELGIPDLVKRALMEDGWICRSTIIWSKPNPMPESVTDRPTKAHEYLFLLTKSARYYYDNEAIKEPSKDPEDDRGSRSAEDHKRFPTTTVNGIRASGLYPMANKRSVWTINTQPTSYAHFATYPEKLVEPCILAGSRPGDLILDPFSGSGTTGRVAIRHNRQFIGTELNFKYIAEIAPRRLTVQPMLTP